MFTGLIEDMGEIKAVRPFYDGFEITVFSDKIAEFLEVGDSIAIDGVCQTVTKVSVNVFSVEAVGATLVKTTFRSFVKGRKVNLERPLAAGGRLDGHFVQGHVVATGRIAGIKDRGDHFFLEVEVPEELCRSIVPNGSIAVDGVSLTVASKLSGKIGISIIPHTARHCTLGMRKAGDFVNLETDLIGRYLSELGEYKSLKIDEEVLKKWGY